MAASTACLSTYCVFDLWLHCKAFHSCQSHTSENRDACPLWSPYPQDPNYWPLSTRTTPTLWSLTLINTDLCGRMSFQVTRGGTETLDYSFVLGSPFSGFSDGFQLKRPETGAGAAEHDACDLPWETDKVAMPLWPRSVEIVWVSGVFPLVDTFKLLWLCREKGGNLCTEKSAFQSESISLSLLPSSVSSPGTAWDVRVVATCGEQCNVKISVVVMQIYSQFEFPRE